MRGQAPWKGGVRGRSTCRNGSDGDSLAESTLRGLSRAIRLSSAGRLRSVFIREHGVRVCACVSHACRGRANLGRVNKCLSNSFMQIVDRFTPQHRSMFILCHWDSIFLPDHNSVERFSVYTVLSMNHLDGGTPSVNT